MFMMNTKRLVVFILVTLCMLTFAGFTEQPTGSGIVPEVPSKLGNRRLAEIGYVDVTAEPFLADSRGKKDCTEALQQAISYARDHQMVCFFTPGEYKVSDTLNCERYRPWIGPSSTKKDSRRVNSNNNY